MRRYAFGLITFLILLSVMPILLPTVAQESEVKVYISGPDALGLNVKAVYRVTVVGGPAEEGGEWRVTAYLTGSNVTGASPIEANQFNETQTDNVFKVNVTATPIVQHMRLNVEAFSMLGNRTAKAKDVYDIYVVTPISLRATVTNPSNSTLKDVIVTFYIDEELIGSSTIGEIGPFSEGTATYSWITKSVPPGGHTLRIDIDLDGDGRIDESIGETYAFVEVYSPRGEPSILLVALIIILTVVIIILLPSTLRKKRRRK